MIRYQYGTIAGPQNYYFILEMLHSNSCESIDINVLNNFLKRKD